MRTSQEVVPCSYEGIEVGDHVIYTTNGMGQAHTGVGIYRGMLNHKAAIDVQTWKDTFVHKDTGAEIVFEPRPRYGSPDYRKQMDDIRIRELEMMKDYIPARLPWEWRTYLQNNTMTKLDDVVNTKRM